MIRSAVRGLGELFITLGLVLLLFVAWQLWWTDVEAAREQNAIASELRGSWTEPAPAPVADSPLGVGDPPPVQPAAEGEPFALVHVPRFGDDYVVPAEEGIGLAEVLNNGVLGHYPGTAMPGEVGNFSLAGHRVTYGRPLNLIAELQPGDPIVVESADTWYVYRMREYQIVTPDRVDVVAPVPGQPDAQPTERLLTLTACHPMYSARQRYIVHAELESWQPKADGEPAALTQG
ncbi:MAG: class E sortase [Actinomycetota bacterium]